MNECFKKVCLGMTQKCHLFEFTPGQGNWSINISSLWINQILIASCSLHAAKLHSFCTCWDSLSSSFHYFLGPKKLSITFDVWEAYEIHHLLWNYFKVHSSTSMPSSACAEQWFSGGAQLCKQIMWPCILLKRGQSLFESESVLCLRAIPIQVWCKA